MWGLQDWGWGAGILRHDAGVQILEIGHSEAMCLRAQELRSWGG